ncbi:GNAT family N-acetyltransferase [Parapedobacter tibetensis]|uniref:GNAT family N-acetyltransferase n=1 Tax=Parapedobacter tibetensis TaxID=2972951 RepID=UPI00214DBB61|nr:GNAT family N-acetyltransferase [Parapedobacter tibetensis]
MINQLTFRLAHDKDAEGLSQMITENAQAMLLPHYTENQWNVFIKYYSPEEIRNKIKKQYTFCAELDNKIVGTIALDKDFIVGFYTRLECLNQGVGKSIMQHLEKFALDKGLNKIQLAASPEGLSFYYKHGWKKIKDITIEHYGVGFKEILMVKQIKKE